MRSNTAALPIPASTMHPKKNKKKPSPFGEGYLLEAYFQGKLIIPMM